MSSLSVIEYVKGGMLLVCLTGIGFISDIFFLFFSTSFCFQAPRIWVCHYTRRRLGSICP